MHQNISSFVDRSKSHQKDILKKQAQIHFNEQVNIRKWNASHGGVYVKPTKNIQPNPYLKNNILKVDENLTLIKINPAWMTRQLSETHTLKNLSFKLVSLKPINPNNVSNDFETKALKHFEKTNEREYYELSDSKFNYIGALVTEKACLKCHAYQGYKLGDIRGGISITLNTDEYDAVTTNIQNRSLIARIIFTLLLITLTILLHKQLRNTQRLKLAVEYNTREINNTKNILQHVLDADKSFLFVLDNTQLILANKTMLDFFDCETTTQFIKKYKSVSNLFQSDKSDLFIQNQYINGKAWVHYLLDTQEYKQLKIKLENNNVTKIFKPSVKEMIVKNKKLHIVIFEDITDEIIEIQKYKKQATIDPLTQIFNRGKFEEILSKEISLAEYTQQPLSAIFLDIDHFKLVNDTYGHDMGDIVLKSLAQILHKNMRLGDSVSRWGGEEFIILLQSTPVHQAAKIAEKLRIIVSDFKFENVGCLTISLGVTEYIDGEHKDNFMKRIDEALYEAKKSGRDKVIQK